MAAPARYNFDLDFRPQSQKPALSKVEVPAEPPVPEVPKIELAEHQRILAGVEARARAEAYEAGKADGQVAAARTLASEVTRLVDLGRAMQSRLDADRQAVERMAVDLSLAVGRKLAHRLIENEPLEEIIVLIRECLGPLRKAPHLVIRLAEADAEAIRPHVDKQARESGFEGRLIVLGEADMRRGDCRIEWADGGIVRDTNSVDAEIDAAVGRYLATRGRTAVALHTDPVRPKPAQSL
ncbi:MAG: FliH/SctL family protein [Ancalomicrobiaceae bacterium]|nr:FliH/SctL family protein [Ancalomicrobiaceae bacterium]